MSKPHNQFVSAVMILFRRGTNTADIADKWHCHESLVTRALHLGRERQKAERDADELARAMVRICDEMGANV